ncbi:hypothetical protein HanRHA438_Chr09g0408311 [Helianthus annuus]|nr:hypothetical protein HanRHA438_Chr09g0408311 [Helianthus annuus]
MLDQNVRTSHSEIAWLLAVIHPFRISTTTRILYFIFDPLFLYLLDSKLWNFILDKSIWELF